MIDIEYRLTQHDDGYRIRDWFRGGGDTLARAELAATTAEADEILRKAYLGPDVDGVEVHWNTFEVTP